jgi:hypothetical protein
MTGDHGVQKLTDLNKATIADAFRDRDMPLPDPSVASGGTAAYFRNLEPRLIAEIRKAEVVVGCVAWLTSEPILRALAGTGGVSIVVQKEDFLRPDITARPGWTRRLRALYEALPYTVRYDHLGSTASMLSFCGSPEIRPVRCVGNHNAGRAPAFPRSHHKFACFCRWEEVPTEGPPDTWPAYIKPYAVWTGSFNFTANAAMSLENALLVTDPAVVNAYYQEWGNVLGISEPLDWEHPWVAPEWRLGS